MGQNFSLSNTSTELIGAANVGSTVIASFNVTNSQSGASTLVLVVGSNKYLLLPATYCFQLQNGNQSQDGTFYLRLRALTNANYRSFCLPITAISDLFGIVPTVCTYYAQVCALAQTNYQITLYITPSVSADDPITLLDNLYTREYVIVGDNSSTTVDFKYVVYNKSTSCFVAASASVTIIMNYSPNGLVKTLSTNVTTDVVFDFIFNGNLITDSYLTSIRPYISSTLLSQADVSTANSAAVYQYGQNYMGTLRLTFPQAPNPLTCLDPSDISPCQVGAIDINNQ